jgi:hypothetical protein
MKVEDQETELLQYSLRCSVGIISFTDLKWSSKGKEHFFYPIMTKWNGWIPSLSYSKVPASFPYPLRCLSALGIYWCLINYPHGGKRGDV